MPNYPTHSRWGKIGAVVVALTAGGGVFALFGTPVLALATAVGAAVTTYVGAIYPDVDHHDSVPRRKAVRAFRTMVVSGAVGVAALNWERVLSLARAAAAELVSAGVAVPTVVLAGGATAGVAAALAGLVEPAIGAVTREHRGWTHSVPVNFALTAAVAVAILVATPSLETAPRLAAIAVVAAFFLGTLVHLGLDGEIV